MIAAAPVLAITDSRFAQDIVTLLIAVTLLLAVVAAHSEMADAARLLKSLWLPALFPLFWMILQLAPMPVPGLSNPIWSSAAIALNDPHLSGHISLDPGSTLRGLLLYLTMASLTLATTFVAHDRIRAEAMLFVVATVLAFMAFELLLGQLPFFSGLISASNAGAEQTLLGATITGTLANAACLILIIGRRFRRNRRRNLPTGLFYLQVVFLLFCLAICIAAVIFRGAAGTAMAVAFGGAIFVMVALIRQFSRQFWTVGITVIIFAALAATMVVLRFQDAQISLLTFSTASPDRIATAQTALAGTGWLGSGVGTYSILARIYGSYANAQAFGAPSTASSLVVEWGKAGFTGILAITAGLFLFQLRSAVRRGRDAIFATTAAAAVLTTLCEAFCDASLTAMPVQVIVAIIVGLGLSQSLNRSTSI